MISLTAAQTRVIREQACRVRKEAESHAQQAYSEIMAMLRAKCKHDETHSFNYGRSFCGGCLVDIPVSA